MGKVIEFPSRAQMVTGSCVCLACRHEFVQTSDVIVKVFQCPLCTLWKAVRNSLYQPPLGTVVQRCYCGGTFFWNIQGDDGIETLCVGCGHWTER
jgi:hypothetical protein